MPGEGRRYCVAASSPGARWRTDRGDRAARNPESNVDALRLKQSPRHPTAAIESSVRSESVLEIRGVHRNRYRNRN
jgi:hypothetical protein